RPRQLGRRAYAPPLPFRSLLVAVAPTLAFPFIAWLTVINTPGWASVQRAFFDPATFVAAIPRVAEGFLLNLQVLGISVITVGLVALLLATLRTLRGPVFFPLRALAAGYTDLFRGLPLIIVLYTVGFGIPAL